MIAIALFRGVCHIHDAPNLDAPFFATDAPDFARLLGITHLDTDAYAWLHVEFDDQRQGYSRADVTYVMGDLTLVGYGKVTDPVLAQTIIGTPVVASPAPPTTGSGKWASPVSPYVVTEPFGGPTGHLGTDLAGAAGSPVYARGRGIVYSADDCPHCPGGHGAVLGTTDALTRNGFGINVVTRHAYADLPPSGRAALDAAGLTNGYLYVRVAHLSKKLVGQGATVGDGTELGERGTSGNSSGNHTHLETRASMSAKPANVFNLTLLDPGDIFAL